MSCVNNIIETRVRTNPANFSFSLNDKFFFIDINPRNETELLSLYITMKQGHADEEVINLLLHPDKDQLFESNVRQQGLRNTGKPMKFETVNDPYTLFYQMWQINHSLIE